MTTKTTLGDRMKSYEAGTSTVLIQGCPKIIRLDGKAFHTFLKGASKPFDMLPMAAMAHACMAVMKEIGGSARIAYLQSDEVTIVLNDSISRDFSPWYANTVQKIVSVSASIFTAYFNRHYINERALAHFDARLFMVPTEDEVINNLIWRQQDASRNSKQAYARSMFSQKQIHGLNGSQLQDKMHAEKQFNWNDAPTWTKRGICISRPIKPHDDGSNPLVVDWEIPVFTADRLYIQSRYTPYDPQAQIENVHSNQG
jgi:tRNA(His) 5'-end guanylyltransferase